MFHPRKLQLYNTLSHQKEDFVPLFKEGKSDIVGMYSCGPTVYRSPSIGNNRAAFTADLIRNTLKYLCGYPVKSVMNITDVGHLTSDGDTGEDKLEKGAKRDGISAWEVAHKYESEFYDGLKKLHIEPFDVMARATDHIPEQQQMIQTLIDKGYTYEVPGDGIYMDSSKVEEYGELMGPNYKKRLENLNAGERVDMGGKKHPTDFALWKFSPTDEKRQMERDFPPYGKGFPGWHIECSAMSSKYLGKQFDIHHGGADHITVHHPNEIAQSECAFDIHHPNRWVKYRVHNEFLQIDGGKMSKSLGNVYTLKDIEERGFDPLDLRYFFFMAQYSNFQNFTWGALEQAKKTRENLQKKIEKFRRMYSEPHSNA
jgi:cysteinyl-tRNA synthetase